MICVAVRSSWNDPYTFLKPQTERKYVRVLIRYIWKYMEMAKNVFLETSIKKDLKCIKFNLFNLLISADTHFTAFSQALLSHCSDLIISVSLLISADTLLLPILKSLTGLSSSKSHFFAT